MDWYVELTYADGESEPMYCTSRDEARERRRWYMTHCEQGMPKSVVKATVRKTGER